MDKLIKSKIHTVIFDLDGTLSDSAILTMIALERIAPTFGFPVPTENEVRMATGYANPEFYRILFPSCPPDIVYEVGRLVEFEEQKALSQVSDKLIFEGCRELLLLLKELGIHMNIASTGDKDHVFPVLDETGMSGFFDTVSCGVPDKTEILRKMTAHRKKSGYIMVGDMRKDYDGARANGIISVGACYGYCRRNEMDFDIYIDKPMDLLGILM